MKSQVAVSRPSAAIQAAKLAAVLLGGMLLCACEGTYQFRLHTQTYNALNRDALRDVFENRSGIRLSTVTAEPGESALDALRTDRADLALVSNSTPFTTGIRAVLPAYESVLHILVAEQLMDTQVLASLRGKQIYVANQSLAGRSFVELIARRQELEPGAYTLVDQVQPGVTDVIVYLGPIDPYNTPWAHEGYRFLKAESTSTEGVQYLLPRMRATTIPARTYTIPGNEQALETVGVTTLIVTRREVPEQSIYQLTKILIEEKPRFAAIAPSLFGAITDKFDPLDLNFPLHSGARRYLQRDEPSVIERYAETVNMLVYVSFLLLTGAVAAYRWRAHRKRDRIDTFYTRTLLLRKKAIGDNNGELIEALNALEEEAITALIDGKLAANESFRIFTDLLARTKLELSAERVEPSGARAQPADVIPPD